MSTNNDRIRFRYGKCLNDECAKAKAKETIQVPARKDFVCPECGKPLRECPPPKKSNTKGLGLIIALAVVVCAALIAWWVWPTDSTPNEPVVVNEPVGVTEQGVDSIATEVAVEEPADTVEVAAQTEETTTAEPKQEPKAEPKPAANPGYGTVNLGYGKYTGELKNGKPHGHGTLVYTTSRRIVPSKDFVANPGDKIEADWRDGAISGGFIDWHHDGDITSIKY